ncbi:MAG: DNA repair protein [Nitrosopumilus sp.]|uniref:DNA repair protein n=1 Tax=Nitrosopumilus sp. TaxID=2024843 RepID=UPI00247BDEA8|nr:DNA repair protein [Nitrosopumilus sp.]MCV0391849.1 DNA repair protein [Nitrosopumilus sp.]
MGFFGKKKIEEEKISENSEEYILKEQLESEVENLQKEFREKQEEISNVTQKIQTVKEEYSATVSNLMLVKKELNQKKMELDVIQREHKGLLEKIKNSQKINDSKSISDFNKTKETLSKMKEELEEVTKKHEELKEEISNEQSTLSSIRKQQAESQKELDEANARLYNAKEELNKKDQFEDTSILTPKEKEFIQGHDTNQKSSAGIIEAAGAVVGSLKSKLNMTQKELETIQGLLEREREEHEITKQELEKLKKLAS